MQEQKKSSKLEESMKMLDYEMKKTDDLLYRMIPKPVAKRLRKGEPAVNTCEVRIIDSATYSICNVGLWLLYQKTTGATDSVF